MKEKIVAIILSLTMIIGLGGTMHTPANAAETKSVSKQVNDILDAKNADVTANFKANVKGEKVAEQLYRTFRQLAFDYNSDYGSYEDGKLVLTKEGEAFYNRMLKLGIASGLNEDGEPIGADVLDLKGTVKSSVIDSQNFNLDLYLQLAKGKNAKAISLNYNSGKIKINLGTLVSFVKEYTGRTVNDIYDALEMPAIEELTLNGINELNKYLKSELEIREVLSYTVYTEEDGEDVADKIGCIKDVNYGEKMYPNFNISSEQLMSTGYGYNLPPKMREALGYKVKSVSDHSHKELSATEVLHIFEDTFLNRRKPLNVIEAHFAQVNGITATVTLDLNSQRKVVTSVGNGRLDAVANAIQSATGMEFHLENYSEHSLDEGSTSRAASYVGLTWGDGTVTWGAGTDTDIIVAGVKALVSAINNK